VRDYAPTVAIATADNDGAFMNLAGYIGVVGGASALFICVFFCIAPWVVRVTS
jgi:hypothetical protein